MLLWDNHTCLPLRPHDTAFLPQLDRFTNAGVNVVSINVGFGEQTPEEHLRLISHFRAWIKQHGDKYELAATAQDIERIVAAGKLALLFDIEGARAVGDQLSLVPMYYDLGVRWMSIAYNRNNLVGGGCMDEDPGLSAFGHDFIKEMERTGMLVCCSHTGARTVRDVLDIATKPFIFSHSNPNALWDHKRNIGDDLILACAKLGGVVGINGVGMFLGANDISSETIARNVDYVAKLAGIDHVGISLDYVFDNDEVIEFARANPQLFGFTSPDEAAGVRAFAAPEQFCEILACLKAMGYAQSDLAKIAGGNWLRVARMVWR